MIAAEAGRCCARRCSRCSRTSTRSSSKHDVPVVRLDGTVRGKARRAALRAPRTQGGPLLVMTTPETLGSPELPARRSRRRASVSPPSTRRTASRSGATTSARRICRIGEHLRALGRAADHGAHRDRDREGPRGHRPLPRPARPGRRRRARRTARTSRSRCSSAQATCARARSSASCAGCTGPGIIYCTTTREVDSVYLVLRKLGIPAHRYHGKMTAGERVHEQEMYMKSGRRTVMVATSAFGLGIDKPDIRYIIHYQAPASLEQYVQEAGRAGRDGASRQLHPALRSVRPRHPRAAARARAACVPISSTSSASALAAWGGEDRTPTLEALALSAGLGPRIAQALLAMLEEAELVRIDDGTIEVLGPPRRVEEEVAQPRRPVRDPAHAGRRGVSTRSPSTCTTRGCRAVYAAPLLRRVRRRAVRPLRRLPRPPRAPIDVLVAGRDTEAHGQEAPSRPQPQRAATTAAQPGPAPARSRRSEPSPAAARRRAGTAAAQSTRCTGRATAAAAAAESESESPAAARGRSAARPEPEQQHRSEHRVATVAFLAPPAPARPPRAARSAESDRGAADTVRRGLSFVAGRPPSAGAAVVARATQPSPRTRVPGPSTRTRADLDRPATPPRHRQHARGEFRLDCPPGR